MPPQADPRRQGPSALHPRRSLPLPPAWRPGESALHNAVHSSVTSPRRCDAGGGTVPLLCRLGNPRGLPWYRCVRVLLDNRSRYQHLSLAQTSVSGDPQLALTSCSSSAALSSIPQACCFLTHDFKWPSRVCIHTHRRRGAVDCQRHCACNHYGRGVPVHAQALPCRPVPRLLRKPPPPLNSPLPYLFPPTRGAIGVPVLHVLACLYGGTGLGN
jgi:hypothetical protein